MNFRRTIAFSLPLITLCTMYGTANAYQASVEPQTGWSICPTCSVAGQVQLGAMSAWVISFQVDIVSTATTYGSWLSASYANPPGGSYAYIEVIDAQGNHVTSSSHVTLPATMGGGFGFPGVSVPAYGSVLMVVNGASWGANIGTAEVWH